MLTSRAKRQKWSAGARQTDRQGRGGIARDLTCAGGARQRFAANAPASPAPSCSRELPVKHLRVNVVPPLSETEVFLLPCLAIILCLKIPAYGLWGVDTWLHLFQARQGLPDRHSRGHVLQISATEHLASFLYGPLHWHQRCDYLDNSLQAFATRCDERWWRGRRQAQVLHVQGLGVRDQLLRDGMPHPPLPCHPLASQQAPVREQQPRLAALPECHTLTSSELQAVSTLHTRPSPHPLLVCMSQATRLLAVLVVQATFCFGSKFPAPLSHGPISRISQVQALYAPSMQPLFSSLNAGAKVFASRKPKPHAKTHGSSVSW